MFKIGDKVCVKQSSSTYNYWKLYGNEFIFLAKDNGFNRARLRPIDSFHTSIYLMKFDDLELITKHNNHHNHPNTNIFK